MCELMVFSRSNKLRSLAGYVCLLAVLLIYAPQAMLAWWTGTGACCTSDYCPIHMHHAPSNAATEAQDGMHCERSAPGLAACTMSCCHDTETALLTPVVFVLYPTISLQPLAQAEPVQERPAEQGILQSSKPPSPPPRFNIAAA